MAEKLAPEQIRSNIESKLSRYFGTSPKEANREQLYKATALTVRDILTEKRNRFKNEVNKEQKKQRS